MTATLNDLHMAIHHLLKQARAGRKHKTRPGGGRPIIMLHDVVRELGDQGFRDEIEIRVAVREFEDNGDLLRLTRNAWIVMPPKARTKGRVRRDDRGGD